MEITRTRERVNDLAIDFSPKGQRNEEDVLRLKYRPAFVTPAVEEQIEQASSSDALSTLIVGMIPEWDMTEDGEPFPLDVERLKQLPVMVLARIATEIAKDVEKRARDEGKG
jgi:hypothetical protein